MKQDKKKTEGEGDIVPKPHKFC